MTTISVQEPDEHIRKSYKDSLEALGLQVRLISQGEDSLEHIRKEAPDIFALSACHPGLDSFILIDILRSKEKGLPIILSTKNGKERQDFLTWSSNALVIKSGNIWELKTTVKEILDL